MYVRSIHEDEDEARVEVKRWKDAGYVAGVIPGDPSLGKELSWFVLSGGSEPESKKEAKPKEDFFEKLGRLNKEFFG